MDREKSRARAMSNITNPFIKFKLSKEVREMYAIHFDIARAEMTELILKRYLNKMRLRKIVEHLTVWIASLGLWGIVVLLDIIARNWRG